MNAKEAKEAKKVSEKGAIKVRSEELENALKHIRIMAEAGNQTALLDPFSFPETFESLRKLGYEVTDLPGGAFWFVYIPHFVKVSWK